MSENNLRYFLTIVLQQLTFSYSLIKKTIKLSLCGCLQSDNLKCVLLQEPSLVSIGKLLYRIIISGSQKSRSPIDANKENVLDLFVTISKSSRFFAAQL